MNKSKKIIKEQGLQKPDKKEIKEAAKSRKNLILIIIGALAILGGVFVVLYTQLRPRPVLTVEGPAANGETTTNTVYYSDTMYDIYQMESMYNAYGMDWDKSSGDSTLSDSVKDQIMDSLKQREVLYMQALKDGTTLDDDEKKEIDKSLEDVMKNMGDNVKSVKGLSESDIRASIEKQKLAEKEKKKIIDGFDIDDAKLTADIKKEDYRQYTLQYYMFSKEDESAKTDDAATGSAVALKDDATISKAKTDIQALQKKAKTEKDFTKLLNDKDNDNKDDDTGIVYSTENLLESNKDFADEKTRALIKKMSNDQISDVIETDKAFYVFKMVNNNDPEAYDNQVKQTIETEENSRFSQYYDGELKKQYTFKVTSYWKERVTVGGITTA